MEDRELAGLVRVPCMVACALRCSVLPISQTRRLSPTAIAVPPLSGKEGFAVHHPLPSFMCKFLRGCTSPSLLPCGRRGTACGGGWRTRWLIRVPHTLAPILAPLCQLIVRYVAPPCQSVRLAGYHPPLARFPLFQRKRAFLRCTALPISRTRRLSTTAGAVLPFFGE